MRDESQPAQLAELAGRDRQPAAAWRLKEEFRAFFAGQTVAEAREFLQSWQQRVKELGNAALQKVATLFERHWPGLAASIEHRGTNALAESLNTQIQLLNAKARGFRDASGYRRTI